VQDLYFWSLGIVRLLQRLVEQGSLTYAQAGSIFEVSGDGARYRLLDDMVFKTHQQIELWARSGERRQQFSSPELEELATFCLLADATLYDIFGVLRGMLAAANAKDGAGVKRTSELFMKLYAQRQTIGQFANRFAANMHGYEVYRMPTRLLAVPHGETALRERVLRGIETPADGRLILAGSDLLDMEAQTRRAAEQRSAKGGEAAGTPLLLSLLEENRALIQRLQAVYSSSSWSLTAPLRVIGRAVLRLSRRA
jgi:hypothetical protein